MATLKASSQRQLIAFPKIRKLNSSTILTRKLKWNLRKEVLTSVTALTISKYSPHSIWRLKLQQKKQLQHSQLESIQRFKNEPCVFFFILVNQNLPSSISEPSWWAKPSSCPKVQKESPTFSDASHKNKEKTKKRTYQSKDGRGQTS